MSNIDDPMMFKLETRIKSFQNTVVIKGKKCRWRYTVIPSQSLARLGFYYSPTKNEHNNKLDKNSITCIYCNCTLFDIGSCKSKKKSSLETLCNILEKHLTDTNDVCLLSHLKYKILKEYLINKTVDKIDWMKDDHFKYPMDKNLQRFREFSFKGQWDNEYDNLSIANMAKAGLVRYDNSYTCFEEQIDDIITDACYCIYCTKIVASWQAEDDPLEEHYKCSFGGKCYFFDNLSDNPQYKETLRNLNEKFSNIETEEEHGTPMKSVRLLNPLKNNDFKLNEPKGAIDEPVLSLPVRKRRRLKKTATQMLSEKDEENKFSDEGNEVNLNTSLIVKFKEHVDKAKEKSRRNRLLDDSIDDISFSNQGHEAFDIPTVLPSTGFENTSIDKQEQSNFEDNVSNISRETLFPELIEPSILSRRFPQSITKLENIYLNDDLSSDEFSTSSSSFSTPMQSPKQQYPSVQSERTPLTNLRHLQQY